jgi:hypothetical protein
MCESYPRYDPFTSASAILQNKTFNITYGTGAVLGSYFSDDVQIGSAQARKQSFGVAAASFDYEMGLFGAGLSQRSDPPTVLETLVAQGQISGNASSVDLRSKNKTGELGRIPR